MTQSRESVTLVVLRDWSPRMSSKNSLRTRFLLQLFSLETRYLTGSVVQLARTVFQTLCRKQNLVLIDLVLINLVLIN